MKRGTYRSVSSLGWQHCLLILILSMSLFSFFLLQPFSSSPSPETRATTAVTLTDHAFPTTLPPPHPFVNYSDSNDLVQQRLLTQMISSKEFVRTLRKSKVIMAWNETAIRATSQLQDITRCYLLSQYGQSSRQNLLALTLKFPRVMIDSDATLKGCVTSSDTQTLFIELAPMMMLPHAFYTITEVANSFRSGKFHRNAPHVLQSNIDAGYHGGVVFMEYDRRYPHERYTLGFAGRGGTDAFYISVENNTMAHGPGTDRGGKDPEADTVFGRILPESNGREIVQQMKRQPGGVKPNGFINDQTAFISIEEMRLLSQTEVRAVTEMFSEASFRSGEKGLFCREVEERWGRIRSEMEGDGQRQEEEERRRGWEKVRLETLLPSFCSPFLPQLSLTSLVRRRLRR